MKIWNPRNVLFSHNTYIKKFSFLFIEQHYQTNCTYFIQMLTRYTCCYYVLACYENT